MVMKMFWNTAKVFRTDFLFIEKISPFISRLDAWRSTIIQIIINSNFFFIQLQLYFLDVLAYFFDLIYQIVPVQGTYPATDHFSLLAQIFYRILDFSDFLVFFQDQNIILFQNQFNIFLYFVWLFVVLVDLFQNRCQCVNVWSVDIVKFLQELLFFQYKVLPHSFKLFRYNMFFPCMPVISRLDDPQETFLAFYHSILISSQLSYLFHVIVLDFCDGFLDHPHVVILVISLN